jgi:heme-degrading monooxygenase HmoA
MIDMLTLIPRTIEAERADEIVSGLIRSMKDMDGFRAVKTSNGPLMSPGGRPDYAKVVEASWETLADMMAWVQSAEDRDGDKDFLLANGGILLFYEVEER